MIIKLDKVNELPFDATSWGISIYRNSETSRTRRCVSMLIVTRTLWQLWVSVQSDTAWQDRWYKNTVSICYQSSSVLSCLPNIDLSSNSNQIWRRRTSRCTLLSSRKICPRHRGKSEHVACVSTTWCRLGEEANTFKPTGERNACNFSFQNAEGYWVLFVLQMITDTSSICLPVLGVRDPERNMVLPKLCSRLKGLFKGGGFLFFVFFFVSQREGCSCSCMSAEVEDYCICQVSQMLSYYRPRYYKLNHVTHPGC